MQGENCQLEAQQDLSNAQVHQRLRCSRGSSAGTRRPARSPSGRASKASTPITADVRLGQPAFYVAADRIPRHRHPAGWRRAGFPTRRRWAPRSSRCSSPARADGRLARATPPRTARLRESGMPVFVHAAYRVNLGSGSLRSPRRSAVGDRGHRAYAAAQRSGRGAWWCTCQAPQRAGPGELAREQAAAADRRAHPPAARQARRGRSRPAVRADGRARGRCSARGPATRLPTSAAVEHHPKAGLLPGRCHLFARPTTT